MAVKQELEEMGFRILNASRTELYLSMHFMGASLNSLGFVMDLRTTTVGTDAAYIRFNPNYLLQMYLNQPHMVNRTYMHMLMHCLFRHMFSSREHKDADLWDISCDIAVESVIDSMDYPAIWRLQSDYRDRWYERLNNDVKILTAERIYQYFMEIKRDPYEEERLKKEFSRCDHSFWDRMQDEQDSDKGSNENKNNPQDPDADPNRDSQEDPDNTRETEQEGRNLKPVDNPKEEEWKKNAKRVQAEIEMTGKEHSREIGSLERILQFQHRKRTDYREFLRRFAVVREEAVIDMDSFDYGFYNYGMQLYGNMPLIEENEFREARRIDELVIVIDTSASCQDTLVQEFLNETAQILESTETFFHKVNIHLIECDDQVQNDVVITSLRDMEKYSKGFSVKGGYGTDFRPAFNYVEELRRRGEIENLKGLMYFTDGFGIYPDKPTDYDTAFVFWKDEEMGDDKVPSWAIKLYI